MIGQLCESVPSTLIVNSWSLSCIVFFQLNNTVFPSYETFASRINPAVASTN